MNVTFHVLAAAGIAHVAAAGMRPAGQRTWFCRSDIPVIGAAVVLAVMSHGILDGLKHGYPMPAKADILCAGLLAMGWSFAVRLRLALLYAAVMLGALAPDVIDLGPSLLHSATGISMPWADSSNVFPWHWHEGSGSMYGADSNAPARARILDAGRNGAVSVTNHIIVVLFSAAGILSNPRVFRFLAPRSREAG